MDITPPPPPIRNVRENYFCSNLVKFSAPVHTCLSRIEFPQITLSIEKFPQNVGMISLFKINFPTNTA
jgi:hypothetical protein